MKLPPNLKRLFRMVLPYKGRLALAFFGMIVTAATEPMFPAVMKILLDKGFVGKPTFGLWMVPVAVIGIFVLRGISTFATSYLMTWITTQLLSMLRGQMFARMLDVAAGFYTSNSMGRIINSMMFEVQQIVDMIRNVLTSLVRDALTVVGLLAFLMEANDFPIAPTILGMVLGGMLEQNFVTSMIKSGGHLSAFFDRPIAAVLGAANIIIWLTPVVIALRRRHAAPPNASLPV